MGGVGALTVNTADRLAALRARMVTAKVEAFVVPSQDQHSSEYLAHADERRAFISGFNGSAGCAIITRKEALLFTDGRYFLQAEQQLDQNWTLMRQGLPDIPSWQDYLSKNLPASTSIGIDPTLLSISDAQSIKAALEPKDSNLVSLAHNPIDLIWNERPARPHSQVICLDVRYSGETTESKLVRLREELVKRKGQAFVLTMLDEVAWLYNLRGSDIEFNPVFFAYAVVTAANATLFVQQSQIDDTVREHLGRDVHIKPYTSFFSHLQGLSTELSLTKESPVLIGDTASLAVAEAIGMEKISIVRSPVADLKAIKNKTEIEGFKQSHIRDGVALARYFAWLEEQLENGVELNESQGADKLEAFRAELDLFQGLSFTTISSTGPNGAIIHYSPDPDDCAIIRKDQIYLCDSGAQFLDGTTDVTRTWHFGTPTNEEKRAFTRVLQGHISIDTAVFPSGTSGYLLDAFARRALWQDGLDYRHGTGHGVGHFLNVHEGPHGIGTRIAYNSVPLKAGMTVSNEPGYYADGRFGVRIENIVVCREVKTINNFGDKGYLGFEHVTLSPMHKKLINVELLTAPEKEWIDDYHKETFEKISPLLQRDTRALAWLKRECSPL